MAVVSNKFAALLDSDDECDIDAKDELVTVPLRRRIAPASLCSLSKASSRSTSPAGSQSSRDTDEYGTVTPPDSPRLSNRSGTARSSSWSRLIGTDHLAPLSYIVRNTFVECVESEPIDKRTTLSCSALKIGSLSARTFDLYDDAPNMPLWPATPVFAEDIGFPHHQCLETVVVPPCVTHEQAVLFRPVSNLEVSAFIPPPPTIHAESTLKEDQLQELANALHARIAELERSANDFTCKDFQPRDTRETRTNQEQSAQWKALQELGLLL